MRAVAETPRPPLEGGKDRKICSHRVRSECALREGARLDAPGDVDMDEVGAHRGATAGLSSLERKEQDKTVWLKHPNPRLPRNEQCEGKCEHDGERNDQGGESNRS